MIASLRYKSYVELELKKLLELPHISQSDMSNIAPELEQNIYVLNTFNYLLLVNVVCLKSLRLISFSVPHFLISEMTYI